MKLKTLLGCLAAYILVVFRHGYIFGSGDQSEMLPYAKYLSDNTLYAKDFYIQSIAAFVPNERFIFSKGLSLFTQYLSELTFVLHAVSTFLLFWGLHRGTQKWLYTEGGRWIATLAPIFFLYNINLGGNELYYNMLTPSYLAQVIGLWVFVYFFESSSRWVYGLIFLATFMHPLIGVQIWLLVTATTIVSSLQNVPKTDWRSLIFVNLAYLSTAGFYIFKIKSGYDAGNISSALFSNIIEFRAPHHYFPNYFPLKNWLILLPFLGLCFHLAASKLRWLIGTVLAGCAVYTLGVLVLNSTTILSTQWFSTSIWLKTFSIITFVHFVEAFLKKRAWFEKILNSDFILKSIGVFSLAAVALMTPQYKLLKNKNYDFLTTQLTQTPEVDIALKAKNLTPKDALFLTPSDLSSFRYWSERSVFIDYKATNHRQAAFAEWYNRIQKVYNISLADRRRNVDLPYLANEHFKQLKENDLLQLAKNQGITHVLTYKTCVLNFSKIWENDGYVIYEIR